MTDREKIIQNYLDGYNEFDLTKMLQNFDGAIVFENISNGEMNLSLKGLNAFKEQAEVAKSYFSIRRQTAKSYAHDNDEIEVVIDYYAVAAMDFPNGLKKGDELRLEGRSIFKFSGDKIVKLTDIS